MAIHLINSYRFTPFGIALAVASGGIAIGGSADASISNIQNGVAQGNVGVGGSATATLLLEEEEQATATVVITGAATASTSISAPASATGNIVIGGSSPAPSINISATGSAIGNVAISGSAASITSISASAIGNIAIGGSATSSISITQTASATGDISITGSAAPSASVPASATGNMAIGGSATASVGIAQSASATGNVVIGGSSATPSSTCWPLNFPVSFPMPCGAPTTYSATGNIVIGGSATASTTTNTIVNPSAAGNVVIGGSATATTATSSTANGVATGNIVIGGSASGVTSMGSSTTNATATGNIIIGGSATATTATSSTASGSATGNIVIGGNATATASTPFSNNYSISLDGANDYITAGSSSTALEGATKFTVSQWVKGYGYLFWQKGATGNYQVRSYVYQDSSSAYGVRVTVANGSGYAIGFTNVAHTPSAWTHITVVYDGSQSADNDKLKVYVNGTYRALGDNSSYWKANSWSNYSVPSSTASMNGDLYLGREQSSFFNGLMDEAAIWSEALSQADITAIYNSGTPNDLTTAGSYNTDRTSDLWAYWRFEDNTLSGSGGTVVDSSGNGNTAAIYNGPNPMTFSTDVPAASSSSTANATATGNIVVGGSATATLGTGASGVATGNIVIGGSATATAITQEDQVEALTDKLLWLDADSITGKTDGDSVSSWTSRHSSSVSASNSTSSTQPVYSTNEINSLPAIDFNADYLEVDYGSNTSQPLTAFIVCKYDVTSGGGSANAIDGRDDPSGYRGVNFSMRSTGWGTYAGSSWIAPASGSPDTNWHIFTIHLNGASTTVRKDSSAHASGNPGSQGTNGQILGMWKGKNTSHYMNGKIAELLIFEGTLSDSNRDLCEGYLAGKYNL